MVSGLPNCGPRPSGRQTADAGHIKHPPWWSALAGNEKLRNGFGLPMAAQGPPDRTARARPKLGVKKTKTNPDIFRS